MATIDPNRFYKRVKAFYSHWKSKKDSNFWNGASVLCMCLGLSDSAVSATKSEAIHMYLFGWEFIDTLILMTSSTFFVVTGKKPISLLEKAPKKHNSCEVELRIIQKNKGSNEEALTELLNALNSEPGEKKVGFLTREIPDGGINREWITFLEKHGIDKVDITLGISSVMSIKDPDELDVIRKAALLTNKIMKHGFVDKMETFIDDEKTVTHSTLASEVEQVIQNPSKIGLKVNSELVESCYSPIIQSGGKYDLRIGVVSSNNEELKPDVVICCLGAMYKSYASNIVRTFLFDAPKKLEATYNILLKVYEKCLEKMRHGTVLKDIYQTAVEVLQSEDPDLVKYLPKNLGFSTGLEFRESALYINDKNNQKIRNGMSFALIFALENIPLTESDIKRAVGAVASLKQFTIAIGDTIIIEKNEPEILTKFSKDYNDISYTLNENEKDDDGDEEEEGNNGGKKNINAKSEELLNRGRIRGTILDTRLRDREHANNSQDHVAQREKKQIALLKRKMQEYAKKQQKKGKNGKGKEEEEELQELKAYDSTAQYPPDTRSMQLKVDMDREAVLVPINGIPVPFHISTIKNVVMPDPDRATFLRINFYIPGQTIRDDAPELMTNQIKNFGTQKIFIRELTFRSLDPKNLSQAFRMIQELRKRTRTREREEKEEADLVVQEKLVKLKEEKVPRLTDLTMRPQMSGRKTVGSLEAHLNGLRFTSTKMEMVEIMFNNIKHSVFQPCDKTHLVIIHFHLKNHILVNKKKTKDVQFFAEVIDSSVALDGSRRSAYDPDEIDEEQRERRLRKKLNATFHDFCKKVEKISRDNNYSVEFDAPYRDLGFYGTPFREMVFIQPTTHCLINLTETPFFVVDLDEIEHVHFENVTFRSKNFNMAIILKKEHEVVSISAINITDFEAIADWLNDMDITFTQGSVTYKWKNVIESVNNDPYFYSDKSPDGESKPAGWEFLREDDQSGEEEEEEDEDDEEYNGEHGEEGEDGEEEEEEEEEEEVVDEEEEEADEYEDEEEDEELDEEDEEEEGMTWDELEAEAKIADKRRRDWEDNEERVVRKRVRR